MSPGINNNTFKLINAIFKNTSATYKFYWFWAIIETVEELTGGEPFDNIADVIDPAELAAISDRYKVIAGYSKESVGQRR